MRLIHPSWAKEFVKPTIDEKSRFSRPSPDSQPTCSEVAANHHRPEKPRVRRHQAIPSGDYSGDMGVIQERTCSARAVTCSGGVVLTMP
jgi:hypothetical protein